MNLLKKTYQNIMIDFLFIEFYLKKKYNQKVEDYFNIGKMSVSSWRKINKIPSKRLLEFYKNEETLDTQELIKKIYKNMNLKPTDEFKTKCKILIEKIDSLKNKNKITIEYRKHLVGLSTQLDNAQYVLENNGWKGSSIEELKIIEMYLNCLE